MRKNKLYILIAIAFCFIGFSCSETKPIGFPPVNKNVTPEAKQLLEFLYSIQGKYTLTGQHNFVSNMERYDSIVHNITGKYPVVWGSDFSFMAQGDNINQFQHCGPMNLTVPYDSCIFNNRSISDLRQSLIDEAKKKYAEGRIITLMWHCCFPTNGDECNGDDIWRWAKNLPSAEEWDQLVTNGTALNIAWKNQMDGVAKYLKQLQDCKIPVLWRPYHEMNGVWFWWCNKSGENGFKKLWIMTYDYLTNHHKLNNLLWVWNTNAPRDIEGDEAGPYKDYFPGTDYVDILAADVYRQDYKQSHHDDLLTLGEGKLISLGEIGQLPTVEQYELQPSWSWFMTWGYFINRNYDLVREIYNHQQSITLDEIDFSNNEYKLIPQLNTN
ncbi:glycosyl hydrolase family 26 [Dysgonomonas sp. Marseille-P4677]|uniref:glycoside hydrolase family 26 protein n=1 Tax=Dysgonomonas sp. Marseille-P4677 TaxID=2364790 RepID=UPI0019114FB7|nr:glycosyl hydrolase [Dysgonomonas sp. Marseille-P4677]MBK5722196.1 glycosyl hydrolase family 26 [Dysgonomonas sp. Marseille-P4677]